MSEQGHEVEARTIRSAGACDACRAKKQKCSGEKPSCSRCQTLGRQCMWPQTQKRGPAKGYIEALEARLCDTEEVLSRVLTYLSADEVSEALLRSNLDSTQPSRSYSGLLLHDRKQAVDVWTNFPLKSADDVKRWHRVQGGSGKIGGALPQDSRGLADAQSAADCGVMSQGPRKNDGRLQSVDGFASTEQEAQQINADENESATGDDTNTAIEGQSNRQSSTVGGQSRMQPHPQSSRSNGVLGLSREFQDRFLW